VVPAALGVERHRVDHLARVQRREGAQGKAAHLHEVPGAERARSADAVRHHRELLAGLQHRDVRCRIGEHLGERDVTGLVVVGLVAHDLELLAHLLRAHGHAIDRVLVVGDLRLAGHVLVGHQLRLAIDDAVGEAGPVHDRAQVGAAQLSVAAVVDVLVGGGVADGEDEGLLDRVEDHRGLLRRQGIRVISRTERRMRSGRGGRFRRRPGGFALGAGAGRDDSREQQAEDQRTHANLHSQG
jgi:hypothetical protein